MTHDGYCCSVCGECLHGRLPTQGTGKYLGRDVCWNCEVLNLLEDTAVPKLIKAVLWRVKLHLARSTDYDNS